MAVPVGTVGQTVPVRPEVMRQQPGLPPPGGSQALGDAVGGRIDPGSPATAAQVDTHRGRPGDPATQNAAARDIRLRMREYGERYGETIRERQETGAPDGGPAGARWLSDAERNQFREALRERYHQHR